MYKFRPASKLWQSLAQRGRRNPLAKDTSGIAAIEFALVVPIMLAMFLGSIEFSQALAIDRRVTAIASATADLVAQSESVSDADLSDIMLIAQKLVGNYNNNLLEITLISVVIDPDSNVTVGWSYDKTGAEPYGAGNTYSDLPAGLVQPGTSIVVAEVSYDFTPGIGHFMLGTTIPLSEKFYLKPRRSNEVAKI